MKPCSIFAVLVVVVFSALFGISNCGVLPSKVPKTGQICPPIGQKLDCRNTTRYDCDFETCTGDFDCCFDGCSYTCMKKIDPNNITWCDVNVDLGILMDTQDALYADKAFEYTKPLVRKVIKSLPVSDSSTHVSIGTISKIPRILLKFNDLQGKNLTKHRVCKSFKHVKAEKTRGIIKKALIMAEDMFSSENGARDNAKKILVVTTDAIESDEDRYVYTTSLSTISEALKSKNIEIFTLGIGGDIDVLNLILMSSRDENVFSARNIDDFIHHLKRNLKAPCH